MVGTNYCRKAFCSYWNIKTEQAKMRIVFIRNMVEQTEFSTRSGIADVSQNFKI